MQDIPEIAGEGMRFELWKLADMIPATYNSRKPGWLVGDLFGGSGSTLMAAEQLGRTAYIMEMDERNVDVIVRRWEKYTGKKAVKL